MGGARTGGESADLHELSAALMRRWRGERSQVELSAELGYASNVVGQWEAGRRHPKALVALQAAELAHPGCILRMTEAMLGDRVRPLELDSRESLALFLGDLMAHRSVATVAGRLGLTRQAVNRWLGGRVDIRLPDLLAFMQATQSLYRLLPFLCPDPPLVHRLPAGWLPHLQRVYAALSLPDHVQPAKHDPQWLSRVTRLPIERIHGDIDDLIALGQLRWDGERYRHVRSVDHLEISHTGRAEQSVADLAQAMTSRKPEFSHVLVGTVSERQRQRIRRLMTDCSQAILDVVAEDEQGDQLIQLGLIRVDLRTSE